MKWIVAMSLLAVVILAGCASWKEPVESPDAWDGVSNPRSASPIVNTDLLGRDEGMPAWEDRPDEEREAFRERH
ncbi:MAG: hypothetical protein ACM3VT_04255 [Solirubrobacterales bacterium]